MSRTGRRMTFGLTCCTWCGVASLVWLHVDCCPANGQPMETLTLKAQRGEINIAEEENGTVQQQFTDNFSPPILSIDLSII